MWSIEIMRSFVPEGRVCFFVVRSTGFELLWPVSRRYPTSKALVWPLDLTCTTADIEDIRKGPETWTIECVVIGHRYGLLVQTRDGVSKRVGLVRFECAFLIDGQMRSLDQLDRKWECNDEIEKVDLTDYFPGVVRTVYLG